MLQRRKLTSKGIVMLVSLKYHSRGSNPCLSLILLVYNREMKRISFSQGSCENEMTQCINIPSMSAATLPHDSPPHCGRRLFEFIQPGGVGKSVRSGAGLPAFKLRAQIHDRALIRDLKQVTLTSLSLSFFLYNVKMLMVPSSQGCFRSNMTVPVCLCPCTDMRICC